VTISNFNGDSAKKPHPGLKPELPESHCRAALVPANFVDPRAVGNLVREYRNGIKMQVLSGYHAPFNYDIQCFHHQNANRMSCHFTMPP
jgi:hypothetical protein